MTHAFPARAAAATVALAAAGLLAAFGPGPAQAATFARADIGVEPRGEDAGGLTCTWRETGLGASQVVYYTCGAEAMGVLKACVYKRRLIFDSPVRLETFKNVIGGEHGGAEPFLSQKNGQISASTRTPIPHLETGVELCLAPAVETVVAVRWCNTALVDVTNALLGATVGELFSEFVAGAGSVPSCAELTAP